MINNENAFKKTHQMDSAVNEINSIQIYLKSFNPQQSGINNLVVSSRLGVEYLEVDITHKRLRVFHTEAAFKEIEAWNCPLNFPWHLANEPEKFKAFLSSQSFHLKQLNDGEYTLTLHTLGEGGGKFHKNANPAEDDYEPGQPLSSAELAFLYASDNEDNPYADSYHFACGLNNLENALLELTITSSVARFFPKVAITIEGTKIVHEAFVDSAPRYPKPSGNAKADFKQGQLYYDRAKKLRGKDAFYYYAAAKPFFESSAKYGNDTPEAVDAAYKLGTLYRHGLGVEKDHTKARPYFERAAGAERIWAQIMLGKMYQNGQGVLRSLAKAREWFERAKNNRYDGNKYPSARKTALEAISAIDGGGCPLTKEQKWAFKSGKGAVWNDEYARRLYIEEHPSEMTIKESLNAGVAKMAALKFSGESEISFVSKPKPKPTKEMHWALKNKKGPLNEKAARQAYVQAHPAERTIKEAFSGGTLNMTAFKFK